MRSSRGCPASRRSRPSSSEPTVDAREDVGRRQVHPRLRVGLGHRPLITLLARRSLRSPSRDACRAGRRAPPPAPRPARRDALARPRPRVADGGAVRAPARPVDLPPAAVRPDSDLSRRSRTATRRSCSVTSSLATTRPRPGRAAARAGDPLPSGRQLRSERGLGGTTTPRSSTRQLRLPVHSRLLRQLGHGLDDAATQAFVDDVFASMATVWSAEIDTPWIPQAEERRRSTATEPAERERPDRHLRQGPAEGLYGYCTTDDPTAFDPTA